MVKINLDKLVFFPCLFVFVCLPVFPVGTAVGALMIGGGLLANYYSNDLNKGWTNEIGLNFVVDVACPASLLQGLNFAAVLL